MAFDVASLEPRIRRILTSPGIDLTTISAKRVRKQLVEDDPNLSAELVKTYKEDIDLIIGSVYEDVSAATNGEEGDEEGQSESGEGQNFGKRKREELDEDEEHDAASSPSEVKKKTKRPKKEAELTDAEIARQLDSEINGRGRASRSGTSAKPARGRGGGGKGSRKKKSAETVHSEGEGAGGEGEKPKKRKGGFTKEYALSAPLAALLSVERMSRPQVVKHIWDHIKEKGLQNPTDKREIICDEGMKAIFNVERINMFKMNKALGDHLYEPTPNGSS